MPDTITAPPPTTTPAEPTTATTPPTDAGERPLTDWMGDTESDFADMDAGRTPQVRERDEKGKFQAKPKEPEKPAKKEEQPKVEKPAEKEVEDDTLDLDKPEKPAEKPAEKVEEKPTEPPKPVKAAELRAAYDNLKKRVKEELEPQLQSYKAKEKEWAEKKPEDTAPIIEKMTALEKRNAELEKQIEYVDYQQSKEFTSKYAEPYREAWLDAVNEFRELAVKEPAGEDENGEPKFNTRAADENDLLRLANMKLSDMDAAATAMFGPSASRAINHIQNLKKLSAAQAKALDEAKNKAGEWKQQRTVESQTKAKQMADMWATTNKDLEQRFPKAFRVEQDNPDDAAAHGKGFALADLMFGVMKPEQADALPSSFRDTIKAGKPLSEAQIVQLHALARLKMANHDRKVVALKKATERIAELEKALAEYEKSEPQAGKSSDGTPAPQKDWQESVADELKALDR